MGEVVVHGFLDSKEMDSFSIVKFFDDKQNVKNSNDDNEFSE
jgi:hypothetical protein